MKKNLLLLLTLLISIACSYTSWAQIVIDNELLTPGNLTGAWLKSGTAHFNEQQKVLTLNNAVIEPTQNDITLNYNNLKIVLKGKNTIKGTLELHNSTKIIGGELTLITKNPYYAIRLYYNSSKEKNTLTLRNCKIESNKGIWASAFQGSNLELQIDNSTIKINNESTIPYDSAIDAWNVINLKNCHVESPAGAKVVPSHNQNTDNYAIATESQAVKNITIVADHPETPSPDTPEPDTSRPESLRVMGKVVTSTGFITSDILQSGTVHYDVDKKELTLDNAVIRNDADAIISSRIRGLHIILKGKNDLTSEEGSSIYLYGSTTITGDELKIDERHVCISVENNVYKDTLNLLIKDCTLDLTGSMAIFATNNNYSACRLTIENAKLHGQSNYMGPFADQMSIVSSFQKIELKNCYFSNPPKIKIVRSFKPESFFNTRENYDIGFENKVSTQVDILPGEKPIVISDLHIMGEPILDGEDITGEWLKKGSIKYFGEQLILREVEIESDGEHPFIESKVKKLPIFFEGNCKITSKGKAPIILLHKSSYILEDGEAADKQLTLISRNKAEAISIVPEEAMFLMTKGKINLEGNIVVNDTLGGKYNHKVRLFLQETEMDVKGHFKGVNSITFKKCHISSPQDVRLEEVRLNESKTAWRLLSDGEELDKFRISLGEGTIPTDPLTTQRISLTSTKKVGETLALLVSPEQGVYVEGAKAIGTTNKEGLNYRIYELTKQKVTLKGNVTELRCEGNSLTSIDVSGTKMLTELVCSDNKLKELNISTQSNLNTLICDNNSLSMLDIANNKMLSALSFRNNNIASINTENNEKLTLFYCDQNKLTSLNLSNNPKLKHFSCEANLLTALDLSHNRELYGVWCNNNQLTELNFSNNLNLEQLSCYGNLIKTSQMGALVSSLPNKEGKLIAIDASNDGNEITKEQVKEAEQKGWKVLDTQKKPVGITTLDDEADSKTEIFDLSGRRVSNRRAKGVVIIKQHKHNTKKILK